MYLVRPPYLLTSVYPGLIWRKDSFLKKIYLTFDDGPVPGVTDTVLDLLQKEKLKATFFCVGKNAEANPDLLKRIQTEGHSVGNHTYDHVNGWNTHTFSYLKSIEKCATLVPSKLFRPPYGRAKKTQLALLARKYSIIMWDVLSGDYDKGTGPEKCLKNVIDHVRPGSIVVFHDSYKAQTNMEYALPRFIEFAKKEGYEFAVL